ncbi:MAG: hypothetical protein V4812_12475 [Pseudomonadota bacterium]
MTDLIDKTLQRVSDALYLDFPEHVGLPQEESLHPRITNFFRNGPYRRVFVFNCDGGDYDYNPDLTEDQEWQRSAENERIFLAVLERAQQRFGPALGHYPLDTDSMIDVDSDDESLEGEEFDGIEWSPSYAQGATLTVDDGDCRYWVQNDRYLFLQTGKEWGDGTFVFFVAMTLSPPRGRASTEGFWPDSPAPGLTCGLYFKEGEYGVWSTGHLITDLASVGTLQVQTDETQDLAPLVAELVNLRVLDVANSNATDFLVSLRRLRGLREVRLEGNRRTSWCKGRPAAACISSLIRQHLQAVETLVIRDFADCDQQEQVPLAYLRGIQHWSGLRTLDISSNNLSFAPEDFEIFLGELRQLNLQELNISNNPQLCGASTRSAEQDYRQRIQAALGMTRVQWVG